MKRYRVSTPWGVETFEAGSFSIAHGGVLVLHQKDVFADPVIAFATECWTRIVPVLSDPPATVPE